MNIFTSSIRTKIIIPYVILTLIVGAAGAFFSTQYIDDTLEDQLKKQLIGAARAANQIIVDQESERLGVLRLILATENIVPAVDAAKRNQNYAILDQNLNAYAANYPGIDSLIVLDEQGDELYKLNRVLAVNGGNLQPAELDTNNGYSNWSAVESILSSEKTLSSGRIQGDVAENDLIYSIAPLRADDKIVGVVMVGQYLEHLLGEIKLETFSDITFYSDQTPQGEMRNTTLILDEGDSLDVDAAFYNSVVGDLDTTKNKRMMVGNQEYELSYAPFQLAGGTLGIYSVAQLTEFVTGPVRITSSLFSVVIFIAIVVLMFIALIVTQQIIRPLARLVSTSGAIAAGDLTRETGIESRDEIGRLAHSFDQMTVQLRRRTEQLEELVKLQGAILSSIADGVLVQDKSGHISQLNPAAEKILSQLSEAFEQHQAADLIPIAQNILAYLEDDEQDNATAIGPIKEISGGIQAQITSTTNPNEEPPRNLEIGTHSVSTRSAPVVTDNDETLGSVIVLRDITTEVEAEKLKTNLIRGISHELLTPLVPMRLSLQMLQMMLQGKLEDNQVDLLDKVDKSSQELHALISTLIDFVQIEAEGAPAADMDIFDINDLVEDVSDQIEARFEEEGLTFNVHIDENALSVKADENRLRRVINALLDNAIKYNNREGQVDLYLRQHDNQAQVQVVDTGDGIVDDLKPSLIRQPFMRAVVGDDDIRGNGLGLYLAGKIIEAHHGKIWFNSEPGQGSTFTFEIPLSSTISGNGFMPQHPEQDIV